MDHVFVWTVGDVVGAVFIGILVLLGLALGGLVAWDWAGRKIRAFLNR